MISPSISRKARVSSLVADSRSFCHPLLHGWETPGNGVWRAHTHTHTHNHKDTATNTHTQKHTQPQTHNRKHTGTNTITSTQSQTQLQTITHNHKHTATNTIANRKPQTRNHKHTVTKNNHKHKHTTTAHSHNTHSHKPQHTHTHLESCSQELNSEVKFHFTAGRPWLDSTARSAGSEYLKVWTRVRRWKLISTLGKLKGLQVRDSGVPESYHDQTITVFVGQWGIVVHCPPASFSALLKLLFTYKTCVQPWKQALTHAPRRYRRSNEVLAT